MLSIYVKLKIINNELKIYKDNNSNNNSNKNKNKNKKKKKK